MDSKACLYRSVFLLLTLVSCTTLALRPIPSLSSSNDTGRYVDFQEQACRAPILGSGNIGLSLRVFNFIFRPACWTCEPRVFLFFVAMALPLALLWSEGWANVAVFVWAIGILISAIGFELQTNALRQS